MVNRETKIKCLYYICEIGFWLTGRRFRKEISKCKNILIIRIDSIGDFVLFTPVLRHLRKIFKEAKISILLRSNVINLAESCPDVDKIISFDKKKYSKKGYKISLIKNLFKKHYDLMINVMYSRSDLIAYLSGASIRVGFECLDKDGNEKRRKENEIFYTHLIPSEKEWMFEGERNKKLLKYLGYEGKDNFKTELWLKNDDREFALNFLKENEIKEDEKFVVVFPGAQHRIKRWPIARFAQLADKLIENFKIKIVICGSEKEISLAEEISRLTYNKPIIASGKTTLRQLAAILEKSTLYIGNDTGGLHIAIAVKTPVVCILGGGHFGRFFPYGEDNIAIYHKLDCFNCYWHCKYDEPICITLITVNEVYQAAAKFLDRKAL